MMPKKSITKPTVESEEYFFQTSEEMHALEQSACDGKSAKNWKTIDKGENAPSIRVYEPAGSTHKISVGSIDGELVKADALERLTLAQDADFVFAMLYIVSLLAPPAPLESNRFAGGWIDLDDVMEKIGWYPNKRTAKERAQLRARVWDYVIYGNRAVVDGARSRSYIDPYTKEVIPTRIQSSLWRIHRVESVDSEEETVPTGQLALPTLEECVTAPRRVEIVIGKEWEPLLAAPRLAQYLPMAQLAGEVSPLKVSGDWARCMSLALARFWRRHPQEVLSGKYKPTRRELLTTYTPKSQTVESIFSGDKAGRAVQYYCDALTELRQRGLIDGKETLRSAEDILKPLPERKWQEPWLNEKVEILPGPVMVAHVESRAQALPESKPKDLRQLKVKGAKNPKSGA